MQSCACADCGQQLNLSNGAACAVCGSFRRRYTIEFFATKMPFAASLGGKGRSPGAKKAFIEFFTGSDWWKAAKKWATKSRTIDRRNDKYYEEVIDPDSGQVIHKCEEPLSKHVFHGSAKP